MTNDGIPESKSTVGSSQIPTVKINVLKPIKELEQDLVLGEAHEIGELVWMGKIYVFYPKYKEWKITYLPKFIDEATNAKLQQWPKVVGEWVEAILPEVIQYGLELIYERVKKLRPSDTEKFLATETFSKNHLKYIFKFYSNKINELKCKFTALLANDGFLINGLNHFSDISDFIFNYFKKLFYFKNKEADVIVLEDFDTLRLLPETVRDSTDADIEFYKDEFFTILKTEIKRGFVNDKRLLNNDMTISSLLSDSTPAKKSKNFFLPHPYEDHEDYEDLSYSILGNFFDNIGKNWEQAISKDNWQALWQIKLEEIKTRIDDLLQDCQAQAIEILSDDETINTLILEDGNNLVDYTPYPIDVAEQIRSAVKHILHACIADLSLDDYVFLNATIKIENYREQLKLINKKFRELLLQKRDQNVKLNFIVLPHVPITKDWQPPQGNYVTYFPADYTFVEIVDKATLFATFKLSERSLRRYFKSLVYEKFFNPFVKINTIEKVKNLLNLRADLTKVSVLGNELMYHYSLHEIGSVTIRYKIENSGIVGPQVWPLGTYQNILERLDLLKKEIQKVKHYEKDIDLDKDIATWMLDILNVQTTIIKSANLPENLQLLLLQSLAALTLCIVFAEAFRNKGSFVTHALVLEKISQGGRTFRDAIEKGYFPMAPKKSSNPGRHTHAFFLENNKTLKKISSHLTAASPAPTKEVEALKQREIKALMLYEHKTLPELRKIINDFWNADKSTKLTPPQKKLDFNATTINSETLEKNLEFLMQSFNATGDDKNIIEHGENNFQYDYSLLDNIQLLIVIRAKKLNYKKSGDELYPHRPREEFSSLRENYARIYIADPHEFFSFNVRFFDDIKTITGTHENLTIKPVCWQSMPQLLIIPLLQSYGIKGHWRVIRLELNYQQQHCSILWDDPCGKESFLQLLKDPILKSLKQHLPLLFAKALAVAVETVNITYQEYDKTLQQQPVFNVHDCGPIILENIEDYADITITNEQFVSIDADNYYTINTFVDEYLMRNTRITHRNSLLEPIALHPSQLTLIKSMQSTYATKKQVIQDQIKNLKNTQTLQKTLSAINELAVEDQAEFLKCLDAILLSRNNQPLQEADLQEAYKLKQELDQQKMTENSDESAIKSKM